MTRDRRSHASSYHLDVAGFYSQGKAPSVVYHYVDERGSTVGAVARFEAGVLEPKKVFLQYRWTGSGWSRGLNGQTLPLYRLPALHAAIQQSRTIYNVEGEKCCDLLNVLKCAATTNPGGAENWCDVHTEQMRGADVVVIPDADVVGKRHANKVCAALHGVAARVRLLQLPGLEEGEDIEQWLARGGSAELLSELATRAPTWTPPCSSNDMWPEPSAFGVTSEPEPFPADALPPELAEFALEAAKASQVDVAATATLLPTIISAAAGNAYSVRVSNQYSEKNLSRITAVGLLSGERKSGLLGSLTDSLCEWAESERPAYESKRRAFDAAKKNRKTPLGDETDNWAEPLGAPETEQQPRPPIPYLSDVTMPELVRRMHTNGGAMAIMAPDARHVIDIVLGQFRGDGQVDDSVLLRAHAGDPIDRARVGNGSSELVWITRPAIAVGICVQPDKLIQLIERPETTSSGLLARTNLVLPLSLVGSRFETGDEQPIPAPLVQSLRKSIASIFAERFRIVDAARNGVVIPIELRLDDEAMSLRRDFHNELEAQIGEGKPLHSVQSIVSKCPGEAARLAGLFHLHITAEHRAQSKSVSNVIPAKLWRHAEIHQRWQFRETLRVLELCREGTIERTARLAPVCAGNPTE